VEAVAAPRAGPARTVPLAAILPFYK